MKLLVLLPQAPWARRLVGELIADGQVVRQARDPAELSVLVDKGDVDCVLVGLGLGGASGADLCRRLRERSSTSIIAVTDRVSEIDTVVTLELGADDYVSADVGVAELNARIRAVARRTAGPAQSQPSTGGSLTAGDVVLDLNAHEVAVRGQLVALPRKEFDLLAALMENAGRVVPRQRLLELIWGENYSVDTKTLDVHIQRLRAKVEDDAAAPRRILTVRGVGYKFERSEPARDVVRSDHPDLVYVVPLPASHTIPSQLRRAAEVLGSEFAGVFSRETVERTLVESMERLAESATIPTYLPMFAERFARQRLRAVAQADRLIITGVPEVLFVCAQNARRSQMAAAFLEHHAKGAVHVRSAGSVPADQVNPAVVEAMRERGIDIHEEFPKPLTDEVVRAADVVVTMGCGDACPVYPGKRYLDWELEDPAGKSVDEVRPIRDAIERLVKQLLGDMTRTLGWS